MAYQNTLEIMDDIDQGSLEVVAARKFFREQDSSKEALTDDQLMRLLHAQRNVKWHKVVSQWWFNIEASNPKKFYALRAQQNPKAFAAFQAYCPEVQQWKASLTTLPLYQRMLLAKADDRFDYQLLRDYLDHNLTVGPAHSNSSILYTTVAHVYQQLVLDNPAYASLWMVASGIEKGRGNAAVFAVDESHADFRRMEKCKAPYSDVDKKLYYFGYMLGRYLEGSGLVSQHVYFDPRTPEWLSYYHLYSALPSDRVLSIFSHTEFKKASWQRAFHATKENRIQNEDIPRILLEVPPFYTFLTAGMQPERMQAFVQSNAIIGDLSYEQLIHHASNTHPISQIPSHEIADLLV
jgi:hypothetical protein